MPWSYQGTGKRPRALSSLLSKPSYKRWGKGRKAWKSSKCAGLNPPLTEKAVVSRSEVKVTQNVSAGTSVINNLIPAALSSVWFLTGVGQGASANQRIGRRINGKFIHVMGQVRSLASTTTGLNVRIYVIRMKDADGVNYLVRNDFYDKIFQQRWQNPGEPIYANPRNVNYLPDYDVVYCKDYPLQNYGATALLDKRVPIDFKIPVNLTVGYQNTGPGSVDAENNHYYMMAVCDSQNLADVEMNVGWDFYFTD